MTTLTSLDSGIRNNNSFGSLNSTEAWSETKDFSYDIVITQPGTYYLDNTLIRQNSTGNSNFQNFTLNYAPIPEPSSALLVGGALGAALLRRRREEPGVSE